MGRMLVCRQWYHSLNNPRYWTKIDLNVVKLAHETVKETLTQSRFSLLESLAITVDTINRNSTKELLPTLKNLKHLMFEETVSVFFPFKVKIFLLNSFFFVQVNTPAEWFSKVLTEMKEEGIVLEKLELGVLSDVRLRGFNENVAELKSLVMIGKEGKGWERSRNEMGRNTATRTKLTSKGLTDLFEKMPKLEELSVSVSGNEWSTFYDKWTADKGVAVVSSVLKKLSLEKRKTSNRRWYPPSSIDLLQLLKCFPNLTELSLMGYGMEDFKEDLPDNKLVCLSLMHESAWNHVKIDMIKLLKQTKLKSFSFFGVGPSDDEYNVPKDLKFDSLESLSCGVAHHAKNWLTELVCLFPNLKSLKYIDTEPSISKETLAKLEKLYIPYYTLSTVSQLKSFSPNLHIYLQYCTHSNDSAFPELEFQHVASIDNGQLYYRWACSCKLKKK